MTTPRDALSVLAPMLRVWPELTDYCRFGGEWRSAHLAEGEGWAAFHIVTKGACMVERAGQAPTRLEAGDVLLLPHGDAHVVYGGDGRGPLRDTYLVDREAIRVRRTVGEGVETELVCGRLHLESATDDLLLRLLPHVIVLRLAGQRASAGLVDTIGEELQLDRAGAAAIARDLASALFVILLRAHLEAEPPAEGLLALLGQRETARAAVAMLKEPSKTWSLDELASVAAVSRATLVRAFRRIGGATPQAFLTEVRLGIARNRIEQTSEPLGRIAADVGYQSEAALSRALQRRFAVRPGAMRQASRAGRRET